VSRATTTRRIRGIGNNVITDASEFSDFDRVAPSRLSARVARDNTTEDDAEQVERPRTRDPHVEWMSRPSLPDQASRMPETVKLGPTVTKVFNLSDAAELEAYNELHQKAGSADGPLVEITANHREFFNGSFYACVAYSSVSYQKL
jgi:hypothetical protein